MYMASVCSTTCFG